MAEPLLATPGNFYLFAQPCSEFSAPWEPFAWDLRHGTKRWLGLSIADEAWSGYERIEEMPANLRAEA
jgi:hypothetical protein